MAGQDPPPPTRTPWLAHFPDVIVHTDVKARDGHAAYVDAKSGNAEAARTLAQALLNRDAVACIRTLLGHRRPILVAVSAIERAGFNAIPDAMAKALGQDLDLIVEPEICQVNKTGHTRASAAHRIVTPARFDGTVTKGMEYFVIDDHIGLGGTIANLKGFLEQHGGHVVGVTTLTASRNSEKLSPRKKTLDSLWEKHGQDLEDLCRDKLGYGLDRLTEAEAGFLYRGPSVDAIRNRLAQAAEEARVRGLYTVEGWDAGAGLTGGETGDTDTGS